MTSRPSETLICLLPRLSGVGGMVSFQDKLTRGLRARGIRVTHSLDNGRPTAILIIGGTRDLPALWHARRHGIPIVQRLDGMNWVHRVRPTGGRHFIRAEVGNLLLALIRRRLADRIVYQSQFVKTWWERAYGVPSAPNRVIYNGVDLSVYTPDGPHQRPDDRHSLLLVEGSLMGGYEVGLAHAIALAQGLSKGSPKLVELTVAGRVDPGLQEYWSREAGVPLRWLGLISPQRVPEIDRSAHLFFSADINAACPNTVIEALACGLPVAGYSTGALPELLSASSGRLAPYGGDPWRLDPPDLPGLVAAAREALEAQATLRSGARERAQELFGLDTMVEAYLEILLDG